MEIRRASCQASGVGRRVYFRPSSYCLLGIAVCTSCASVWTGAVAESALDDRSWEAGEGGSDEECDDGDDDDDGGGTAAEGASKAREIIYFWKANNPTTILPKFTSPFTPGLLCHAVSRSYCRARSNCRGATRRWMDHNMDHNMDHPVAAWLAVIPGSSRSPLYHGTRTTPSSHTNSFAVSRIPFPPTDQS